MMNAPTNMATPAKISMNVPNAGDVGGERCLVLVDERGARDDLDVAADRGLDRGGDIGLRHACVSGDGDRVGLAGRRQQLAGRRVGEQHRRRPGGGVGVAERGDAGDRELARCALGEHGRDVTRRVAGRVGARLVDDDLVVVGGRVTARQLVRVQVVDRHPVRAERRVLREVADGLAVAVDELGVAVDAQRDLVDAVDRGDGVDERGVEARAGLAVAEVDLPTASGRRRRVPALASART